MQTDIIPAKWWSKNLRREVSNVLVIKYFRLRELRESRSFVFFVLYLLRALFFQTFGRLNFIYRLIYFIKAPAGRLKNELHVARKGALGDVLMCLPAIDAIKQKKSKIKIFFYSDFHELLSQYANIDCSLAYHEMPNFAKELTYVNQIPPSRHIAELFADQLGTSISTRSSIFQVDKLIQERMINICQNGDKKIIVINRKSGPWSKNKDWPNEYWDELILCLTELFFVVEIGGIEGINIASRFVGQCNFLDLRGKTNLFELFALMSIAQVHIGPISGPVHVAATVGTRSIVIYGGYENPICSAYEQNTNLYSPVSCSPCWLRTDCPIGKICLRAIPPSRILKEVYKIFGI